MIESLYIKNFKCFEEQNFKIAPLTLLSGLNGMGKSTVIQSLLLLRQSFSQGTLDSFGLSLNGDLIFIGTGHDALYQYAQDEEISFEIKNNQTKSSWTWNYIKDADVLPLKSKNANNESYNQSLFNDNFHYLNAERIGPRTFFPTSNFQVSQHQQIGVKGEYAIHFLAVYGNKPIHNQLLLHPKIEINELKSQVDAWMSEICPGTRLSITPHLDMDLINLRYQFVNEREVSNSFRSSNVGFGLTTTLSILIALLSAPPGSIFILENPEVHLHPKGQALIGKLLAIAAIGGVQVIVETHSDHVLNGIRVAIHEDIISNDQVSIHFFEKEIVNDRYYHKVFSPKIDSNGRIDKWSEGFFDEWDKSLDALLEPKNKKDK